MDPLSPTTRTSANYDQDNVANDPAVSVIVQNLFKSYVSLFSKKFINNFNINQNNLLLLNENTFNATAASGFVPATAKKVNVSQDMFEHFWQSPKLDRVPTQFVSSGSNSTQTLMLIHERVNLTAEQSALMTTDATTVSNTTDNFENYSITPSFEETLDLEPIWDIIYYFLSNSTNHTEFVLFFVLIIFAILTIFGNLLVIISINIYKKLHTPTNYLIKNLAFTDLLVGIVIMPVAALHDIALQRNWPFGVNFCDFWRSMDVLLSTTSILNLCFISYDRYYALQNPFGYKKVFTKNLMRLFCALTWGMGIVISFPAIIWWRYDRQFYMPPLRCLFTSNQVYLVLSSVVSFYVPLSVMVVFYWKIYRLAMEQNLSLRLGKKKILILKKKKKKKRKENFLRNSASALPFFMASLIPAKPVGDSAEENDADDSDDEDGKVVFQNLRVHRGRGNSETATASCSKPEPVAKPRNYSAGSVQILNEKASRERNGNGNGGGANQSVVTEDLTSISIPNNLNLVMNNSNNTNNNSTSKFSGPSNRCNSPPSTARRSGSEAEMQSLSCKSPSGSNAHHRSSADGVSRMDSGTGGGGADDEGNESNGQNISQWATNPLAMLLKFNQQIQKRKRFYFLSLKMTREKKAAKTLSIVMGVFLLCWCPFFICNLTTSVFREDVLIRNVFGGSHSAFERLMNVVGWFGWINSLVNPIIYACWSTEFRKAFIDIIKRYFYRCCWICGGKEARKQLSRNKFKRQSKRYYKR